MATIVDNGPRLVHRRLVAALLSASIACSIGAWRPGAAAAGRFDTETASFAIAFHDEVSAYREMSAFVLPRERLTIRVVGGAPAEYVLREGSGVQPSRSGRWVWTAPDAPGATRDLSVEGPREHDVIVLHVFIMVPAADVHNGMFNGYAIGSYPTKPLNGNKLYLPPTGFIEVTRKLQDTRVTPHFHLKQFLCKQGPADQFPKYVVLEERLLLKLEGVLEQVNALGFRADTLHVMSAYRTPYYNRAIGDVLYSMHQWGSAADIYIDKDNKDRMDDLTADGRVDIEDAKYLYDTIEGMLARGEYRKFEGGLGFYPATSAHPPFVHVDVRGTRARWAG